MSYTLSTSDVIEIIEAQNANENSLITNKIGFFDVFKKQINESVHLIYMDSKFKKNDITVSSDKTTTEDIKGLSLNFSLDGAFKLKNQEIEVNSKKNHTSICYLDNFIGDINYHTSEQKNLSLFIEDSYLNRFFPEGFKKNILLKNNQTDIKTLICINEILNSPYTNELNSLFVESKVLEILTNEFSYIQNMKNKPKEKKNIILSEQDILSLEKAREILIKNFDNPPSIKELSKLSAINEFKLKSGFKLLFDITPYALVRQCRMQKAKDLLLNTDLNINEIALEVGFKSQGHFSKNYFEFHGVLAKEVRKSRKYYY